jgi:hypothetical protein
VRHDGASSMRVSACPEEFECGCHAGLHTDSPLYLMSATHSLPCFSLKLATPCCSSEPLILLSFPLEPLERMILFYTYVEVSQ